MASTLGALSSLAGLIGNLTTQQQQITPTLDPQLLQFLQGEQQKAVMSDAASRGLVGSTMTAARRSSGDLNALVQANQSAQTTAQQQIAMAQQGLQAQNLGNQLSNQADTQAGTTAGLTSDTPSSSTSGDQPTTVN